MTFSKFNYYKFKLLHRWKNYQFKTEEELKHALITKQPLAVYKSIAQWRKPLKVERYKGKHKLKNTLDECGFVNSEILMEVDCPDDLERGKAEIKRIKEHVERTYWSRLLELKQIMFSGGGFYLICNATKPPLNEKERFKYIQKLRELLALDLIMKGFQVDYPVCIDPWRVRRVEGTYNLKRNRWAQKLDSSFQLIGKHYSYTPVRMPKKADDTTSNAGFVPATKTTDVLPKQVRKPSTFLSIRSIIEGVRDKAILYLVFSTLSHKTRNKLTQMQSRYKLGTLYFLIWNKRHIVMCLDALPKSRLDKIYNFIKPNNLNEWRKFRNCFILFRQVDADGKDVTQGWKVNSYWIRHSNNLLSRPHWNLLRSMQIVLFPETKKKIGNEKNKSYEVI